MDGDRRQYSRAAFREGVQYKVPGQEALNGCLAYDISEGGIRFQGFNFVPLNTIVSVHIGLDLEKSLDLQGKVVWVQQAPHMDRYYVGLEFDHSQAWASSRSTIQNYIKSHH